MPLLENSLGVILHLYVQPRASKTEIIGLHGTPQRLKVRLAAPPVDGEANTELLKFLCKILKVPKSQLQILRGESSRNKDVQFVNVKMNELREQLSKFFK